MTSSFTLAVTIDDVSLTADGSDLARVRVTVLDQNGNPPPIGSSVFLSVDDGNINQTGESTGDSFTDAVGTAQFTLQCDQFEGGLRVLALYEGDTGFLREEVSCQPAPAGDWTIALSAEPRRLPPRAASQITVAGLQGNGQAVPVGTSIIVDIVDGEGVRFSNDLSSNLVTTADASGTFTSTVFSGEVETEATVCARFADQRFGSTSSCVILIINDFIIEEAICVGAFSDPNPRADGEAVTRMSFTVFGDSGAPVADADIDAEILLGDLLEFEDSATGTSSLSLITDLNGDATAFVRSPAEAGSAGLTATATYIDDETGDDVNLDCQMPELTFAPPPDCLFVPDRFPMEPQIIGVRNGGRPERGALRACFTDIGGIPIAAGQRVTFAIDSGDTDSNLVATRALTDAEGCANTELKSGQQAGTVEVRATLDFGENASTCTTGPLSIRGGRPSSSDFVLHCGAENLGSLLEAHGTRVPSTCEVPCFVYAADRWGNSLPDRTNTDDSGQAAISELSIFFDSEQGLIASPGLDRGDQFIETVWIPRGEIPEDVEPQIGELVGPHEDGTSNPRDGLVTLIAYTTGEEEFEDANGDGIYNEGERFTDLPEPFIDFNDNNIYEPEIGETFVDVNTVSQPADGVWSPGNGVWDEVTTIWTSTHVVLSGRHHTSDRDPSGLHAVRVNGVPITTNNVNVNIPPAAPTTFDFFPTDANGNTTSPNTTFGVRHNCSRLAISERSTTGDRYGNFDIAYEYTYHQGVRDDLEPTDDWDFRRPVTEMIHDPAEAFIQSLRLQMLGQPGDIERCTLSIDYSYSEAASCGSGEAGTTNFNLTIPPLAEDGP